MHILMLHFVIQIFHKASATGLVFSSGLYLTWMSTLRHLMMKQNLDEVLAKIFKKVVLSVSGLFPLLPFTQI